MKPITYDGNGHASWTHQETDSYEVTGITRDGKRFKNVMKNWWHCRSINVWRGTKWLVRDGERYKIQSITN